MTTVAVKNVSEELYRKVKALASLKGRTVGEVVNDALRIWVQLATKGVTTENWAELDDERRRNNAFYERNETQMLATQPGKFVAIANGREVGTFNTAEDAYVAARGSGAKQAIVTQIEKKSRRVVELGWSMVEELA